MADYPPGDQAGAEDALQGVPGLTVAELHARLGEIVADGGGHLPVEISTQSQDQDVLVLVLVLGISGYPVMERVEIEGSRLLRVVSG